jgi:DNA-binding transcriptional regulator YiaG
MSRLSTDEVVNGHIHNGFDYNLQIWIIRGVIQPCTHPARMRERGFCCNQNKYAGLIIGDVPGHEIPHVRKGVTMVGESLRVLTVVDPKEKRARAGAFKQHRLALGASQTHLAAALGVDVMTISRWERAVHAVPSSVARLFQRMTKADLERFTKKGGK